MDKNFFRFDIDDEIISKQRVVTNSEIVQKQHILNKKRNENPFFVANKSKNCVANQNKGYQKNNGLTFQKQINNNHFIVEDYVNFDFKAKSRFLEKERIVSDEYLMNDGEVLKVIERAHIGVIFY